ncbi:anhydro-N-acetylmuramic acid kinase [Chitinophagaceae bacterium MMS25-I14]
MIYKVIGLMSGSSLDGLDIVYTHLEEVRGQWSYEIKNAACISYSTEWENRLRGAVRISGVDLMRLHAHYGHYLAEQVLAFMEEHQLDHKVDFIASHGHTLFHDPADKMTFQLGDGAAIAAQTGLPVISDLRSLDVALGGQGAPIVPVGDKLLFASYDYLLNLGGIANLTVKNGTDVLAFDVCPANQVLNTLAQKAGKEYDDQGNMAASGALLIDVLADLNEQAYYKLKGPKSLSNDQAMDLVFPSLLESGHEINDMLHTMVQHIADQVAVALGNYPLEKEQPQMLITGGGALNAFLVHRIQAAISDKAVITVPDVETIQYKEALVMALIGALRWREETNVYSSVTGASRDSIGGALWMGHSY